MAKGQTVLTRIQKICLSLPDTKETLTWGKPHFRVGDKIFAGFDDEGGNPVVGFKLTMEHARQVIAQDPRFSPAPYVGHKGWVSMDAAAIRDWNEVRGLILESYRLIAPKKSLAKLGEGASLARAAGQRKKGPRSNARARLALMGACCMSACVAAHPPQTIQHEENRMSAKLFRVILPVSNLDQAARFYSTVLGTPGMRVSGGRHYFDCGGTILACFSPREDGDGWDARPNQDHLYFAVENLESTCEACRRAGAAFAEGEVHGDPAGKIARRPWGERSFYIKDPFGNPICFVDAKTVFRGPRDE